VIAPRHAHGALEITLPEGRAARVTAIRVWRNHAPPERSLAALDDEAGNTEP
jgi:hypothetical protein